MDNQLIAKITQLVLEKIAESETKHVQNNLTSEEIQEWASFDLLSNKQYSTGHSPTMKQTFDALTIQELENWDNIHLQPGFSVNQSSTIPPSSLINFKKYF